MWRGERDCRPAPRVDPLPDWGCRTRPAERPARPRQAGHLPHRRLNLASTVLLAILLFGLGQTAGETAAYLTDSQAVGANTFSSAAQFAPTGLQAVANGPSIALTWDKAGFAVAGYNVYRATAESGPYVKVNAGLVTDVTYEDPKLADGLYYYVIRLVNGRGVESATDSDVTKVAADGTAPSATIGAPTSGQYVTTSPFTIAGTASDALSGVSLVEVSTDSGASWHAATGTTNWSYSWAVAVAGSYTIQARARDAAGNVQSPVTSVTVTYDASAPYVVPPTWPSNGATATPVNRGVSIWFSETMDQTSVQSAFSLKPCTTSACTAFSATWTAPTNGSISWYGENSNVLRFTPSANMASNTWYQISVSTAARDLAGNAVSSTFTSVFQTDSSTDVAAPTVTMTAPSTTTWTSDLTYTLTGASDGLLVRVYRDNAPTGSFGAEDTLATTGYTYGGATGFSIPVTLNAGVANRFLLTATDASNNVSAPTFASLIYQGEARIHLPSWGFGAGNTSLSVYAPYIGDANGNASARIRWRTPSGTGTYTPLVAMTRYADYFGYTITGLAPSTTYQVEVQVTDADGIASGSATSSQNVTTAAGATTGLLSSVTMGRIRLANRASQTANLIANVTGSAKYVQFIVDTSGTDKVSSCLTPSGGVATYAWDGTNGSGTPEPDNYYAWTAIAYPMSATGCSGASETMAGYLYVTNAQSIAMSPLPASVTLGAGQSACITAMARNRQGYPVEDGAVITFSYSSSPAGGSYTLTQPSTGRIGGAAAGCSTPAAGSGQAVARLTVNAAVPSTVYIDATMNTQLSGTTGTTVTGSTTLNDPPDTPSGLEVTLVSAAAPPPMLPFLRAASAAPPPAIGVRFQAPRQSTTAGAYLLIGTAPRTYTRKIDLGTSTTANVADGLVAGQRYYLAVQAYNRVGVLSAPSSDLSVVVPTDTTVTTLELRGPVGGSPVIAAGGRQVAVVATARNRAGQPVAGAAVSFAGPSGARFEPARGVTGPDGTVTTQVTLNAVDGKPAILRASSGAAETTLELPAALSPATVTVTPALTATAGTTATPTVTVLPSATATATATAVPSTTATATPTLATTATPSSTVRPTETARPTSTPLTPTATSTPLLTATVAPTSTPVSTSTAVSTSTQTPHPTVTAVPTITPRPTMTAEPTTTPTGTPGQPEPTGTPAPEPTRTPRPTSTTAPTPTALPTATAIKAATSTRLPTSAPAPTSAAASGQVPVR